MCDYHDPRAEADRHAVSRADVTRALRAAIAGPGRTAAPGSVLDAVARASPWLTPPTWLGPYLDALDSPEPQRVVFSAPPQHGKSEATAHALAMRLFRPRSACAYATYSAERAGDVAVRVAEIATALGIAVDASRRLITCPETGASVLFVGAMGALTGYPIRDLLVVDDPIKNALEASSPTYKRRLTEWFRSVGMTRIHRGASVVVMATRWEPDDLSGVLIDDGWQAINLPALGDSGALAPLLFDAATLETRRAEVGEHYWWSMYQGSPRPRGGSLFRGVSYWTDLPRIGHRWALGCDLAYSSRTQSDWSVLVELCAGPRGEVYVTDVQRAKVPAPEFALVLSGAARRRPGTRIRWHAGGTELGVAQFLQSRGVPLDVRPAKGDKFTRAQSAAAAWNSGRIMLPDPAAHNVPWLDDFVSIVHGFTGSGREHDDDVDALVSALDAVGNGVATGYASLARARERVPPRM